MVPACHGYNHKYNELHKVLIDNDDPFNNWCCMKQFNEFEGKNKEQIRNELEIGKKILEKIGPVNYYVPPCNELDDITEQCLKEVDYKVIFSDGKRKIKNLPIIPSQFYARIKDLNVSHLNLKIYTLHVTWEFDDLYRNKVIDHYTWKDKLNILK